MLGTDGVETVLSVCAKPGGTITELAFTFIEFGMYVKAWLVFGYTICIVKARKSGELTTCDII